MFIGFFIANLHNYKSIVYISFLIFNIFYVFYSHHSSIVAIMTRTRVPIILFPKKVPYNFVFHNICTIFAAAKRT